MTAARASRIAALAAALILARPLAAAEIAGGASLLRIDGDDVWGGAVSYAWRLEKPMAFVVEASLHSGNSGGEDLRAIAVYGGVRYRMWREKRLHPFISLKLGVLSSRRQVEIFGTAVGKDGVCDGGCPSDFGPTSEVGGGLDLRLTQHFALRIPEAEYRVSYVAGEWEHGLRVSGSVVVRW